MLEKIDLKQKVTKETYKRAKKKIEVTLGVLQREAAEKKIPIVIMFEGWDAAGKGTLINELILPLDPRGFTVHSTLEPTEEEALRPFLWRFWTRTPARGRIAIFDRSWYRRVWQDRADGKVKGSALQQAFGDIRSFERQLADDGTLLIKIFLHISKKEQKKRFEKLRSRKTTAWRVSKEDLKRHRKYERYLDITEDMLAETDTPHAPWTIIEAHDRRFAALKLLRSVSRAIQQAVSAAKATSKRSRRRKRSNPESNILGNLDLSLAMDRPEYRKRLKKRQEQLRELEYKMYVERLPVVIVYEGSDAAGKGGSIRRLTRDLDPRGYEVVPIAAPNDIEKAHHYLWRFWNEVPKAGHLTIFDRSWYGRVLVERVEGFCSEEAWQRAYREITEMEQHLTNFGVVLIKFWLHIDPEEQLRRFKEREKTAHKQWKITEEDWRNREKRKAYDAAVEEMLLRTSTPWAPWTVVESNCKWYARVKALDTVVKAIQKGFES